MSVDCIDCKDFLNRNKSKFGILDAVPKTECLDLCVQNVRCIATKQIKENIPLPSINGILNNCRGIIDYPGVIDTKFASFRVTGAKEQLVNCDTKKPGVKITISGQIVVRSIPTEENCPATYIAIPVQVVDEVLYGFYSTKDGSLIPSLKNELTLIDGSCMVVQLSCSIYKDTSCSCPRYMARIRGNVIDKLWKRENIWVEGIRPYPTSSLTFCDEFNTCECNFDAQNQGSFPDDDDDCGQREFVNEGLEQFAE